MNKPLRFGFLLAVLGGSSAACASILGDFTSGSGDGNPLSDGGADGTIASADGAPGSPDAAGGDGQGNGGQDGQTSDTGPGPGTDACSGGACADVACPTGEVACGATCANLASSAANCGQCGHSCGASTCVNSACTPQTLVSGIDTPTGFAIDSTSIYFAVDNALKRCPLTGCATGETQLASYTNLNSVQIANGNVTFVGTAQVGNHPSPALYSCPVTGCVTPADIQSTVEGAGGFIQTLGVGADLYFLMQYSLGTPQTSILDRCVGVTPTGSGCTSLVQITSYQSAPIAADATHLYFAGLQADAGGASLGVAACGNSAPCATPTVLVTGEGLPVTPSLMAVTGGVVYFVGPRDIGTGGTIYSCPVTGCAALASLDSISMPITSFTADPSGLYFTGTQGSSTGVFTCPLAGCGTVGPVEIVSGQTGPTSIVTDATYVYWVNGGADAGTGGASILRVAK
jgi:hypothetical protein